MIDNLESVHWGGMARVILSIPFWFIPDRHDSSFGRKKEKPVPKRMVLWLLMSSRCFRWTLPGKGAME